MEPIRIDADRVLRPVTDGDVDELNALIERNREHLAPWMPWAAKSTRASVAAFVTSAQEQAARDDGDHLAIVVDGRIAGVAGFHKVDRDDRQTNVGYWLAADAQGRGTMTLAVAALVSHAFDTWDMHRVELHAALDNRRSRALAERLGFVQEGVLREAERFDDRFVDLALYSVLVTEWRAQEGLGAGAKRE